MGIMDEVEKLVEKAVVAKNQLQYSREIDKVLKCVPDGLLKYFEESKAMIAGGALVSAINNTEINDIDLYFRSAKDAALCIDASIEEGYVCSSWTNKSCVLSKKNEFTLNLIFFKYFDNLDEVFSSFDFTCVMAGIDLADKTIHFGERFIKDTITKTLFYSTTNFYPIGTMLRIAKYEDKGYTISRNEFIKILLKVSTLDLKTIDDIEDQVGSMYGIDIKSHFKDMKEFNMQEVLDTISRMRAEDFENIPKPEFDKELAKLFVKKFSDITKVVSDGKKTYIMVDGIKLGAIDAYYLEADTDIEYKMPIRMYKVVKKDMSSFHDSGFFYPESGVVEASNAHGMHFETIETIKKSTYWNKMLDVDLGCKIIEVIIEENDFVFFQPTKKNETRARKATVVRVLSDESEMLPVEFVLKERKEPKAKPIPPLPPKMGVEPLCL